MQIGSVVLEE